MERFKASGNAVIFHTSLATLDDLLIVAASVVVVLGALIFMVRHGMRG
jgi:hypothetical protein